MWDIVRDATLGQVVNRLSHGKLFPYADQRPGYIIPERYLTKQQPSLGCNGSPTGSSDGVTLTDVDAVAPMDLEKSGSEKEQQPMEPYNPFLVTWDGPSDPDNPKNWSRGKKVAVAFLLCLLTCSVYIGSAIYTPSIPGLMEDFGVGTVVATLGLSLFIFGYGISPIILTPLQDLAKFGRTPIYIICTFLFALFQMPVLLAKNFETILIFRFFAGICSGPAMSTGGASMMDLYSPEFKAYAIATWAIGATAGPVLGPIAGGYAAQIKGWRWPIYELLWLSSFSLISLVLFLPETLGHTILHKRAARLRKLTGNQLLRSQSEIDEEGQAISKVLLGNVKRTFIVAGQPAVMFANVYLGFAYGCFYTWFEGFPLVFGGIYGFGLGAQGLPFIGFVVAAIVTYVFYIFYQRIRMDPRAAKDPNFLPEERIEIALVGAIIIPLSLLIFGWTSRTEVHWIVPVIAASSYLGALFLLFQGLLMYLANGYHNYAGPILAGNK
ncbi:MFS transporter, DHA1 family, multidrug resistance protein, partial [Phenoliferia sp. Uapishka_3]